MKQLALVNCLLEFFSLMSVEVQNIGVSRTRASNSVSTPASSNFLRSWAIFVSFWLAAPKPLLLLQVKPPSVFTAISNWATLGRNQLLKLVASSGRLFFSHCSAAG